MSAKSIMIQGTMSGAGKSLLCTALCRIFAREGYRVAPFKSQNMALNSCVTGDGLEMGRAQAVQAAAANVRPDVRMNPILLKPCTDTGSQVIVNGKVLTQLGAKEYYQYKKQLIPAVKEAYDSLAAENDLIVIEGAGSPAEINLRDNDFVNMGLAQMVNAPVLLAGDIDRGGVFAQLVGTVDLLEPEENEHIKGFVINKFRGDPSILDPGLVMLEDKTHIPVLGVIPYLDIDIDDEDSLAPRLQNEHNGVLDVAVVRFPRISNFTDFAPLEAHPQFGVRYVEKPGEIGSPDLVILPGTKSTISDLIWLRESGMEAKVLQLHARGVPILGICGGYQMLGKSLSDPYGTEGGGTVRGLGLLPLETVFQKEKHLAEETAVIEGCDFLSGALNGAAVQGYEIHTGETEAATDASRPESRISAQTGTRWGSSLSTFGTYFHGLFDTGEVTERLATALSTRKGLSYKTEVPMSHQEYENHQFDILADAVQSALDMTALRNIIGLPERI